MTTPADDLLAGVTALKAALAAAVAARDEYKALYEQLGEDYEKLKQGLLGQKAERVPQEDLPQPIVDLVDMPAAIPCVVAVVLGGSHVFGAADVGSDWDLGSCSAKLFARISKHTRLEPNDR